QPDRAGARDVDGRARRHARRVATVVARREDVRQHRQVEDLLHRLFLVGELEQVPVRVRDGHVLGLAAHPAAHVDVAVRRARAVRVDVQADAGVAGLAAPAAAAGDVERDGAEVALLDELDPGPGLDDLAGDLVAEDQPVGRGGAATDHVLVGAADVRRDDLEDRRVGQLPADVVRVDARAVLHLEAREVDVLHLDLAGAHVCDATVLGHVTSLRDAPAAGARPFRIAYPEGPGATRCGRARPPARGRRTGGWYRGRRG